MSSTYKITCKVECKSCEYCQCYNSTHKYPFHCYNDKTKGKNPTLLTDPWCGKKFKTSGILKKCKYLN